MSESAEQECTNVIPMEMQLFSAVKRNDRHQLRELILSSHSDPRLIRNEKKQTLLHVASKHGFLDIVRTLVEIYQLCPFEVDQFSYTSCHLACHSKHLHVLAYFFGIGGFTHITEFQPLHISHCSPFSEMFARQMVCAAASSKNVELARFAYMLLGFNKAKVTFNGKINLFYDSFDLLRKVIFIPEKSTVHNLRDIIFFASCCGDNLEILKVCLDEFMRAQSNITVNDYVKEHVRYFYGFLFESSCRLDQPDIVSYLIKRKGQCPNQEPCLLPPSLHRQYALKPYTHDFCFHHDGPPLHAAVQSGNVAIVETMITQSAVFCHAVTSHLTASHGTLLHSACVSGKLEVVKMVIQKFQCDVNAQNRHGNTPLHVACEWGWFETVQFLVEQDGCDINILNNCGYSPFTLAIKHSRTTIFNFFMSRHDLNLNVTTSDTSETPLHLACCCHSSEFALTLLNDQRYTCSLNAVDKFGDTPLFNCCRLGNIEIIQKIIAKSDCTRFMVNHITKETPAHIACRKNRFDILKLLSLPSKNSEPLKDVHLNFLGESLLCIACYNDAENIVDFLIENGISKPLSQTTQMSVQSPLHIACKRGSTETVKRLLNSEICLITDLDINGNTYLHHVCMRQQIDPEMLEIVSESITLSEMVEKKNVAGQNALHLIFKNDGMQVLHCMSKFLNIKNLNNALSLVDGNRNTPLHIAFQNKRSLALKLLLKSPELAEGVSKAICMQNSRNYSPLHILCKLEYLQLLLQNPHISIDIIRRALALPDQKGRNIFHIILDDTKIHDPNWLRDLSSLFKTFLMSVPEADIVSILCFMSCDTVTPSTPIQCLIRHSRVECEELSLSVISWLENSPLSKESITKICSVTTSEGETLVHIATRLSHSRVVKSLVTKKLCDPAKTNDNNETALHYACSMGQKDVAYFLCENGCSVHHLNEDGNSPIVYLLKKKNTLLLEGLLSKGYCHPTKAVQAVKLSHLSSPRYCHIMISTNYKMFLTELPLLHSMVYNGYNYKILLAKHKHFLSSHDSFGNTILHLRTFYNLFINNIVDISGFDLSIQNKEGNTPLHIACATGSGQMINKLIESDQLGKSIPLRNIYGHSPLYYTSNRDVINKLIMNGADPSDVEYSSRVRHLTDMFKKVKSKHPLGLTVTALVVGNSLAGKTTLIKSLTKAYNWDQLSHPSIGQIKQFESCERTAGIEISEYKVSREGAPRVLFYDFAGQPEYHSSHCVLLQNRLLSSDTSEHSPNILYVIVIDITSPEKVKQLIYWTKFIQNCQFSSITGRKPEVIIIGSHVDKYSDSEDMQKRIKHSLCQNMEQSSDSIELIEHPILLNCCDPKLNELQKFKALLIRSTKSLKEHAELDNRCHLIFSHLYNQFPDKPVKFSEFQSSLRKRKLYDIHFITTSSLIYLLKSLHSMQHILLIGLNEDQESLTSDFWIMTAKAQNSMFHEVHGLLFAGEEFSSMQPTIESNVGVVSSTEIKSIFPDIKYEMLQEFLVYSEFCRRIDDKQILQLIEEGTSSLNDDQSVDHSVKPSNNCDQPVTVSTDDRCTSIDYFFFPGLVKETREKLKLHWKPDSKYSYSSGWSLECARDEFLNPLFLQVLLLRLTFQFAATSVPGCVLYRECMIWKNGIFWSSEGVEMLVEVTNQNQVVIVLVRCLEDTELDAIKMRSAVLKEVHNVKERHCQATKADEFFFCNPTLDDHGSLVDPPQKVAMKKLVPAIIAGKKIVHNTSLQYNLVNKDLLCFEPYAEVGSPENLMLLSCFDPDKAQETVPEHVLSSLYDKTHACGGLIDQFKQLIGTLNKPVLYQNLRDLFDKHSIFHGREPKVSASLTVL